MDSSSDSPTDSQASSSSVPADQQASSGGTSEDSQASSTPTVPEASCSNSPADQQAVANPKISPAPVRRVNCMVLQDERKKSKLAYDRSAKTLKDCKKDDFHFGIEKAAEGEVGIFKIVQNGQLLRQNISKTFPKGSIAKAKQNPELNACSYIVYLEKNPDISVQDYFSTPVT